MHLWSSISPTICQGTLKEVLHLNIVEISLQKSSCTASINAFCTAKQIAACHLVAYGRTATAYHHMIWFYSQKQPIYTISASVPQLSATFTTLHNLTNLPWYFPAVTLICLLCNTNLCILAKQSIITS